MNLDVYGWGGHAWATLVGQADTTGLGRSTSQPTPGQSAGPLANMAAVDQAGCWDSDEGHDDRPTQGKPNVAQPLT